MVDIAEIMIRLRGDSSPLTSELENAARSLTNFGGSAASAFSGAMAPAALLGAAVIGIGALAVESAKTIGGAYKDIEKQTGATGAALDTLKQRFNDIFAKVPDDAHAVASALSDVSDKMGTLASGISDTAPHVEDLTTKFLDWARISGTSVTTLIDDMTHYANAWKMIGPESSIAMDQLQVASEKTHVSVGTLMTDIDTLKSGATRLGLSFEDTAAQAAIFEEAGIKVSSVNMAMNKTVTEAGKAGEDAGKRWQEDVTTLQQWATQGNTAGISADRLKQLTTDFGARALPQMELALRANKTSLGELKTAMDNSGGTITQRSKDVETFAQKWDTLKHNVELALAPLGVILLTTLGNIATALIPVVKDLTDLANWFGKLPQPVKDATGTVALFAIGLPIAGAALTALGVIFTTVTGFVTTLTTALGLTTAADTTLAGESAIAGVALEGEGAAATTGAVGVDAFGASCVTTETSVVGLVGELGLLAAAFYAAYEAGKWLNENQDNINKAVKSSPGGFGTPDIYGMYSNLPQVPIGDFGKTSAWQTGGIFGAVPGGHIIRVAEGGEAEALVPQKYWGGIHPSVFNAIRGYADGGIVGGGGVLGRSTALTSPAISSSVGNYLVAGLAAIGAGVSMGAGSLPSSTVSKNIVSGLGSLGDAATGMPSGSSTTDPTKQWSAGITKTVTDWTKGVDKSAVDWQTSGAKWGKQTDADVLTGTKNWQAGGVNWGVKAVTDVGVGATNWLKNGVDWGVKTVTDVGTGATSWLKNGVNWGTQTIADVNTSGINWTTTGVNVGSQYKTDGGTVNTNWTTTGTNVGTQFISDSTTAGNDFARIVSAAITAANVAKTSSTSPSSISPGSSSPGSSVGPSGNPAGDLYVTEGPNDPIKCISCEQAIARHPGATVHYGSGGLSFYPGSQGGTLASGGIVGPVAGGVQVTLAEAGEAEAVLPQRLWDAIDPRVLASLKTYGSNGSFSTPRLAAGGIIGDSGGLTSLIGAIGTGISNITGTATSMLTATGTAIDSVFYLASRLNSLSQTYPSVPVSAGGPLSLVPAGNSGETTNLTNSALSSANALEGTKGIIDAIISSASSLIDSLGKTGGSLMSSVKDIIGALATDTTKTTDTANANATQTTNAVNNTTGAVTSGTAAVVGASTDTKNAITSGFSSLSSVIGSLSSGGSSGGGMLGDIGGLFSGFMTTFSGGVSLITDLITMASQANSSTTQSFYSGGSAYVRTSTPTISPVTPSMLQGDFSTILSGVTSMGTSGIGLAKDVIGMVGSMGGGAMMGLQRGGIVTKPMIAMLGENYKREAVTPLPSDGSSPFGSKYEINITVKGDETNATVKQMVNKFTKAIRIREFMQTGMVM